MRNGTIIEKQRYPSPNPRIDLYLVTYMSEGLRVKGLLAEPKEEGTYDGFVYLRGGIKGVGMVRIGRIVQFASEGFVVMAPFYRGNQGGQGNEDFAGDDRFDAVNAYELLAHYPKVNQNRIHLFGFSRGGVMALLTGILIPEVRSVVVWGGVSDMVLTYEEREDLRRMMKRVIGGTPHKYPERYKWRTPLHDIHTLNAPVFIIHGEQDQNVSVEHSYRLEKRLVEAGKSVQTRYYPQYTHYFPPQENRKMVRELTQWMKEQ
ncbi:alpha/beta hydrolase family protein [Priestia koreensis]|uniref:alpha/beta hydrolase family protein n=1 Tax=Priestia koreensis TaxID=284581 RepID=UPI001F567223|nr:prolyl oligopeptidase family serine peptidase [Priestia koreensis]MCM3002883.1 prolyl oligopeptidase family serine peptidase [Priestia koreensis]UNL84568.1 S9 family peptidase [Priestia koreensis]